MDVVGDTDWASEDQLPSLSRAQIRCLKLFRHRCLKFSNSDSAVDVAKPAIKLLVSILSNGGSPKADMEMR